MSRRSYLNRVFALALGAAVLVGGGTAFAQGATNPKVAVINTEKILLESQTGKKALAELKKIQDQREKDLQAKQQEIKDLQSKINDGQLSLAKDKLDEMDKQLEEKVIQLRRAQDDAQRELNKKKDETLGAIDQKVMPVINQVGKELGYTMIFRKFESGLIYADEAIDITPMVIQRLDGAAPAAK